MNLHDIASGIVSAVNPNEELRVRVSIGSTVDAAGKRQPLFAPEVTVTGQVQALTFGDLRQLDALNIQGIKRAIYISGRLDGLVRPGKKGGDLIQTEDDSTWLVAVVLEYWPDWCKVAATLQNDTAYGEGPPFPEATWPG